MKALGMAISRRVGKGSEVVAVDRRSCALTAAQRPDSTHRRHRLFGISPRRIGYAHVILAD